MTDTNKTNDSWFVPLGKSGMEAKARELWKRCMPWSWEMCETDPQYRPKQELFIKFLTEAHREGITEGIRQRQEAEEFQGQDLFNRGMEEAAKVNEALAEKIKHTSHADGLGMGSQCCENRLKEGAAAIREKTNP